MPSKTASQRDLLQTVRELKLRLEKTESLLTQTDSPMANLGSASDPGELSALVDVLQDEVCSVEENAALKSSAIRNPAEAARRQAEEALRLSEEKFAKAFSSNPAAIAISRLSDGVILDINETCQSMFGYRREEVVGRSTRELKFWLSPDRPQLLNELSTKGFVRNREQKLLRKSGEIFTALVSADVLVVSGEKLILSTWLDITELKLTEDALRESEARLRLFIEHAPAALAMFDREMRYLSASHRWLSDYGLEGRDLTGLFHYEVFPKIPAGWKQAHARGLSGEVVRTEEDPFERADGSLQWLRWEIHPWHDASGDVAGIVIFTEDITERKLAAEALRKSEERFRVMFEGHGAVMMLIEPETGAIIDANAAAANFYGYTSQQLRSMHIEQINQLSPGQVAAERRNAVDLDRNQFVFPHRLADSQIRWVEVHSSPVIIQDRPMLFSVIHDITARRQAEAALYLLNAELEQRVIERTTELAKAADKVRAERKRFLDVLETLPVVICLIRPDYRLEFVNRAYRDALGHNQGLLCHKSQFDRDTPCAECQAFMPLETGQPHKWEWALPNGRIFEIHNFPFADIDGAPMILEMDVDITERRTAEKKLLHAHEELEARAAQLRQLAAELTLAEQRERKRLALVLHDGLQQMLVAAKIQVALIGRSKDIPRTAADITNLIDDCIQTSRSLTAELSPPILHQGGLVPGLEWLVQWMFDKHGLSVELTTQGQTRTLPEEITILLFQSVRELLFNIVKHAGIRTARVGVAYHQGRIQVEVADEGSGFDSMRLGNRTSHEGSGMGLFSIRERLGYLGGTMEIDAAPGKGTRLQLVIPAIGTAGAIPEPGTGPRTSVATTWAEVDKGDSTKIRVVLVDDHLVMRQGLASLLSIESDILVVGEASDGKSAIDLVLNTRPAVVLMDISMSGIDGVEATKRIREKMPEVKIIGLSMFQEGEQASAILEAGAIAYLAKSGPSTAVIEAIRNCMRP